MIAVALTHNLVFSGWIVQSTECSMLATRICPRVQIYPSQANQGITRDNKMCHSQAPITIFKQTQHPDFLIVYQRSSFYLKGKPFYINNLIISFIFQPLF